MKIMGVQGKRNWQGTAKFPGCLTTAEPTVHNVLETARG